MRVLMWFALGFTASCTLGAYCFGSWILPAAVILFSLSLLLMVLTHWLEKLKGTVVVLVGVSVGLGWFATYDHLILPDARELDGTRMTVSLEALDYSQVTDYGCAFDGKLYQNGRIYQVRVYLNTNDRLSPGDRVKGEFRFSFTMEKSDYYPSDGVFLTAYSVGNTVTQKYYKAQWYVYPAIWRAELKSLISRAFPEDTAAFAKALLIGDRSGIDYETNTAFKTGGISHVIAVSGLHVSILFGLIYFITARRRALTALLGIPIVVIFAAIAGFSPSITRASIMQCLVMLAMLFDREYDPLTALGFSALVMELVNPMVTASVSFQLSMGCMIGIFLFSEKIREWIMDTRRLGKWKGKLTRWFSGSVSITLSAMVFTTPLVAWYFGTVSLIGILTNLLTLWVITFVFYGIIVVCLLGLIHSGAAAACGWVVAWPIRFVLTTVKVLSSLPLAAVYTKSIYVVIWLAIAYILLGVFLLSPRKPAVLFVSLLVLSLGCAIGLSWLEPMLWECHVTVLDVGQGQAVILQGGGKTYLVDCGGDYDAGAADAAAETLLSRGIQKVDGIILTHLDRDHAGGVELLLTRIDTDTLYLPRVQDETGAGERLSRMVSNTKIVGNDLCLSFGDTQLSIFAPVSYDSGNESSMCILFQTKNCDILIPGDRGFASERMLLKHHTLPQLEVLVVGHHGSKYSTCKELLAQTMPEVAIISAGEDNPYEHPAEETLERLLAWGCSIFCTADNGTIVFRR